MLAIIQTGGKQYVVKTEQSLKVEKLPVKEGEKMVFDKVLLTADDNGGEVKVGAPYLNGVTISAIVEKHGRGKKIRVEKYKRKVRYHKVYGHRQEYTQVKIA